MYQGAWWRIMFDMTSGERWRLGHRPALDGLRGIAIVAVLIYHGSIVIGRDSYVPSLGVVGVTVFFTLSGFLITTLLLEDREAHGRIRYGHFYRLRALRLLPALIALIAFVCVLGVFVDGFVHVGSVLATLFYVQNWYSGIGGTRDALGHTWTLSIEEQFYLLWPIALGWAARYGWRCILALALTGAAVSAVLRNALYGHGDAWQNFSATYTKADALLIGCALAVVMSRLSYSWVRVPLVVVGLAMIALASEMTLNAYQVAAPTAAEFGTAVLIFGACAGRGGIRALEWGWLTWFGRRSYGLYLWHVPVMALLMKTTLPTGVSLLMIAGGSLVLTELSWRLIEQPFMRRRQSVKNEIPSSPTYVVEPAAKVTTPVVSTSI